MAAGGLVSRRRACEGEVGKLPKRAFDLAPVSSSLHTYDLQPGRFTTYHDSSTLLLSSDEYAVASPRVTGGVGGPHVHALSLSASRLPTRVNSNLLVGRRRPEEPASWRPRAREQTDVPPSRCARGSGVRAGAPAVQQSDMRSSEFILRVSTVVGLRPQGAPTSRDMGPDRVRARDGGWSYTCGRKLIHATTD